VGRVHRGRQRDADGGARGAGARHAAVAWHHAHVFRAWVDAAWLGTDAPRALTFETVFAVATDQPHATLSPRALAALLGES
jgi:hypothetical protein